MHADASTDPPSLQDATVLVTGGAGFIGSHIADALVDENDVRVLDNQSNGTRANVPDDARFIEGDIRDPATVDEAMTGVDVVFHEAAMISVPESIDDPRACQQTNADATLDVLEAARREDARAILASSVAIYGPPDALPISETDPKEPSSPYGVAKLATDHYARLYHDLYGVETVALRYFNVYGPRQSGGEYSGVISTFLEQAQSGQALTVHGDGSQTRDFVHVDDVVRANLAAATTDQVGRAYNVGTGESITIRELAELVQDLARSTCDIVHTDARPGDIRRSRADISRARSDLGFEPRIPLRNGLDSLITPTVPGR